MDFGEPTIDLAKLRAFKDTVVKRLTGGTGQLVKHRKVRYVQGRGEVVDARTLHVAVGGRLDRVRDIRSRHSGHRLATRADSEPDPR